MITVTRLNGKELMINSNLIEFVEDTPDTVITFTNGVKIVVKENPEQIRRAIIDYKKEIFNKNMPE